MRAKQAGLLFLCISLHGVVRADEPTVVVGLPPANLSTLSLEELSNIEITSVSKAPEKWREAPAAVYVITQDAIRRSGVRTLAEALRLAPGVDVARINSNQWSIGIRGFGSRLSRSVLVMIDGRSVYSPLFAGSYWEVQDYVLTDIDRIEVIRGPGGALWGANAVNGVINIITKQASETQGGLVSAGGGTEERVFGALRYGGKSGETGYYRVYAKSFERDGSFHSTGDDFDDWRWGQGGFRSDWTLNSEDSLTVQGDLYWGKAGQRTVIATYAAPYVQVAQQDSDLSGANVLGRWQRQFSDDSDMALQWYYDRTNRIDPNFREFRNTTDIDFQHRFPLSDHQLLTYGVAYRFTSNLSDAAPTVVFDPANRTDHLISGFIQNQITLSPSTMVTLGAKIEHNDYTGWEFQPSGRVGWTATETQSVWAAVSRAVRTPSAVDSDLQLTITVDPTTPVYARVIGNKNFESEKLIAYEAGYRVQPADALWMDVAAFYNDYDDLLSLEPQSPFVESTPLPAHTVAPYQIANGLEGEAHGAEVSSSWEVLRGWRARAAYSLLLMHLRPQNGSLDTTTVASTEGTSPRHQVVLQSSFDLPLDLELDPLARYVDHLSAAGIPSYWNMDLRLSWHPSQAFEVAVVGQNLLKKHHVEFDPTQEIERGAYGRITWHW